MRGPYGRLLKHFVAEAGGNTYDRMQVLYRAGVKTDNDSAPTALRVDIYVTTLTLPSGHQIALLADKDDTVEWFELNLGVDGVYRISIGREYSPDEAATIDAFLTRVGI